MFFYCVISTKHMILMLVHKAYKYELDPNNCQRTSLLRHAGLARFVYNWGLEQRITIYKKNQGKERFTNAMEQHKQLTVLKQAQFSWMYECSKCVPQEALRNLDRAFKNFYCGLKQGRNVGFPKFKKKGTQDSFRLYGCIRVVDGKIQLPRIGKVRLKERKLCYYGGKILSATVKRRANKWFVSIAVEEEISNPLPLEGLKIGVDLGIKTLATLSDGKTFSNSHALNRLLKKLRRISKNISRKKKGSRNREKEKIRLSRLYLKIFNIRQDSLHKLTTYLAKTHSEIVIEDLGISGMLKNRRLARAIMDVSWYEFRRQLGYKCKWYGSRLIIAQRGFPSTKMCSHCGHKKNELSISQRKYVCELCGLMIDRDLNAALNLVTVSLPETQNACGEDVSLLSAPSGPTEKQTSAKQEPNISLIDLPSKTV